MKIKLKKDYRGQFEEVDVEKGTSIEELYLGYEEELPYRILAAKVNNKLVTLAYKIYRDCNIEFLDMRTQVANLIYQSSLNLIYLKAVKDILGCEVDIQKSFSTMDSCRPFF